MQLFHVSGTERHLVGSALTDDNGRFALRANAGSYVLQVAYVGHAPSELALKRAGFAPFALENALRIGSSSPVFVAGLLRREV